MAFQRSRNPKAPWNGWNKWKGFRRKRKIPLKALSRAVAKKRYDWVTIYNDIGPFGSGEGSCLSRCIEFGNSYCEEPSLKIPIMTAGALQTVYQDDITIRKMVGFINWVPSWTSLAACDTEGVLDQLNGHQWPIYLRAGLYKQDVPLAQAGLPTDINPIASTDWSDESPLKSWQHIWQPTGRRAMHIFHPGYPIGVCGDVTRSQYTVPAYASGGGPAYNVPAIETDCDIYTLGQEECIPAVEVREFDKLRYWRMSLNRTRPIRLRENDDLSIFANWSMPRPDVSPDTCDIVGCTEYDDGQNPCKMRLTICLKVLIQYG